MPQRGLAWQLGSQTVLIRLVSAIDEFPDPKLSNARRLMSNRDNLNARNDVVDPDTRLDLIRSHRGKGLRRAQPG